MAVAAISPRVQGSSAHRTNGDRSRHLARYAEPDIIAHCLWEMTFFGYTLEDIRQTWDEIIQSRDSAKTYSL